MRGLVLNCGACPYLPEREFHAFHPVPMPPAADYRQLMDQRFRRSGDHVYMPACRGCDECKPVRVDCDAFKPREDQRRCARRNRDLTVSWAGRGADDERLDLYHRYQSSVHGRDEEGDPTPFLIADGGVPGGELHARDGAGRLLAVSLVDRFDDCLSSVYCYFDPDQRHRALGVFMALAEISWCQANGRRWLYLGFLVHGCRKMAYKARYLPQEVLDGGRWVRSG